MLPTSRASCNQVELSELKVRETAEKYFASVARILARPSLRQVNVSIVVPVYNKANYLAKTLDSLLAQSHENIELILVNDGSTDASAQIMQEYAGSDLRVSVVEQGNRGLSGARNTGLEQAGGSYVMFFDADDILLENAVFDMLLVAIRDDADIVAGLHEKNITVKKKGGSGRKTRKVVKQQWKTWNRKVCLRDEPELVRLYRSHISACNKLFRTEFLKQHELKFVEGLYMQDLEFWLRSMFIAGKVSFTPYVVSRYFVREDGASQERNLKRFPSVLKIYELLEQFYEEKDLQVFRKYRDEAILSAAIFFFLRWFLEEVDRPELNEARMQLIQLLERMPEEHLQVFLLEPIGPVLLAFRAGQIQTAANLLLNDRADVIEKLERLKSEHRDNLTPREIKNTFAIV